jgi:hypothetical protein
MGDETTAELIYGLRFKKTEIQQFLYMWEENFYFLLCIVMGQT